MPKRTRLLTKEEIIETLTKRRDDLSKYGVRRIGIFGSYVRNEQDEKSDIDLVVEFDMSSFDENFTGFYDTFISLSDYLESLFGRKTDILTPVSIETIRIKKVAEEIKRSIEYV